MIIPDKFNFTSDEDARRTMTAYIRENFSATIGPKINLLDLPNGLDLIDAEAKRMRADAASFEFAKAA